MGEHVACVTMRQRIAWIYVKVRTRFPIAIYPRNSNWKSMISVPLPMQKVVKNSWCGASLVGLVLKSYVTNGTLVYVLLSKKINLFMGGHIGPPLRWGPYMWQFTCNKKTRARNFLARASDWFEIPPCVGMTNQSITLPIPFCRLQCRYHP